MISPIFRCEKLPFKILVTGHNDIRYIDIENRQSEIFYNQHTSKCGISSYYGITWDKSTDTIFIIGTPVEANQPEQTRSLLIALDKNGSFKEIISKELFAQAHQIQYYDNKIFICDTKNNRICAIDIKDTKNNRAYYPEPNNRDTDINHFNSILICQDEAFIVAHNLENPSSIYHALYRDKQLVDIRLIDQYRFAGKENHNTVEYGDLLLTCNSGRGCIMNRSDSFINIGWYPRGIILHDNLLFVGKSQVADRDWRSKLTGEIEIFDLLTKQSLGCVIIPEIGQIYELRCLNQQDEAHPVTPIW